MVSWKTKALAGFLGALCIALVRLTKAGFYLGVGSSAAFGGYLTHAAYLIVGAAVAAYFAENFEDAHKTSKSAFMFGILPPSVLLTIISTPQLPKENPGVEVPVLPAASLSVPFVSEAFANPTSDAESLAANTQIAAGQKDGASTSSGNQLALKNDSVPAISDIKTTVIPKKDASPTFIDGIKSALGIASPPPDLYYVVGKTQSKEAAMKSVELINSWLKKPSTRVNSEAHIFKAAGRDTYYVTVGAGLAPIEAERFKQMLKTSATNALINTDNLATDKAAAAMAIQGQSLPRSSLFSK